MRMAPPRKGMPEYNPDHADTWSGIDVSAIAEAARSMGLTAREATEALLRLGHVCESFCDKLREALSDRGES